MSRIMALDFGQKRCGIAVTDPLQIISNGLTTIASNQVIDYILNYLKTEDVSVIVVGQPRDMQYKESDASRFIEPFVVRLRKAIPENIKIERYDERFTSKIAFQSMIDAGLGKKKRQDKALVDTISAALILQSYMESKNR